ncbi:MAG TPA: outer membrane protein assembly factor BamA [Polyangiales bacterium]|nr:outer membrane protein assembly factor BamA [Polyangiales bacterium]
MAAREPYPTSPSAARWVLFVACATLLVHAPRIAAAQPSAADAGTPPAEAAEPDAAVSSEPPAAEAAPAPSAPAYEPPPENTGPRVPETICQGKRIVRIDVAGQGRVSADDIRATLKLREGLPCQDGEVTRDAQALWDLGYFRDVRVIGEPSGDGIIVRFEVLERPAIANIVYVGQDHVEQSDIEEKVTLKPGGILSVPDVRAQIDKIKDVYADKGYFLAKVRYELADRRNNEVDVRFIIEEGEQVKVRRIRFVGNEKLKASELKSVIQTSESNVFSFISNSDKYKREPFDEDLNRIHALYYDYGYLTVELADPRTELSPDRRYIDITIPIKEGPRFKVGRVKVSEIDDNGQEIEPLPGRKQLRSSVNQNPGDYFSRSTIAKDLQDITRYYRDRGYAKVEVNPETGMHMDKRLVDISLTVRRGPLVYVERINIKGNTKTRDGVLRREARIVEGELYSQTLVERSKERMTALGYFESVTVSEEPGSTPDKIVINYEVAEKPTGTFQLGAGFSSQEVFLLNGQIQQDNLFGRGQSLALNMQFSGIRQLAQLRFVEPYLFETDWSSSVEIFKILQQRRDFDRDSTGGSITLGHPLDFLSEYLRVYGTYRLEYIDINPSTGGVFGRGSGLNYQLYSFLPLRNLFNSGLTSAIRLAVSWDSRNNRLFPTEGFYAMASTEISDEILGSDTNYIRNEINLRFYKPIWGPFVAKLNTMWGLITSRDGAGVPIYERYFLGGISDIRGFKLQSIGPRIGIASTFGDPTFQTVSPRGEAFGGNMEFYYNFEIEFPLIESVGIKGVVFQDAGNAWNLEQSLCGPKPTVNDRAIQPCGSDITHLRTSWGFGIRWFSPLGPLRFEWGFPFNPRHPYEDTYEFQFNVGNSF